MKFAQSIAFKTARIISIPVLALLAVLGVVTVSRTQATFDMLTQSRVELVQARGDQMEAVVNGMLSYTKSIRSIRALQNPAERRKALLDAYQWSVNGVAEIMYIDPEGNFMNTQGETGTMLNKSWFRMFHQSTEEFTLSPPYISPTRNVPVFAIVARIPDSNANLAGYIGTEVKLVNLSVIAGAIKIGDQGFGWIADGEGTIVAHPDQSVVFNKNMEEIAPGISSRIVQIMDDDEVVVHSFRDEDGEHLAFYNRIAGTPGWGFAVTVDADVYYAAQNMIRTTLLAIFILCVAVMIIVGFFIGQHTAKPIKTTQAAFEQLSSGNADLTARIESKQTDEIGLLVGAFNTFLDKLRDIVASLKQEQEKLDEITQALSGSAESTKEMSREMTGAVGTVQRLTERQNEIVNDSSAGINQITANIESLDNLIAHQSSSIVEASAAIEEMVHNISSVASSMGKMSSEFTESIRATSQGKETLSAIVKRINHIVEGSRVMLDVNRTISKIAAQTNLLAMNAAIEAAHAGEAGAGFSVVADEIRTLAENSAAQSKLISKELGEIQKEIVEVEKTSRDSERVFGELSEQISRTENLVLEIQQALQEQNEGSQQILIALKEMNGISEQVRSGASEMRTGSRSVLESMENLRDATGEISESMKELETGSAGMSEKAETLAQLTDETAKAVSVMDDSIGAFTV